jgi:hypothetical protein
MAVIPIRSMQIFCQCRDVWSFSQSRHLRLARLGLKILSFLFSFRRRR